MYVCNSPFPWLIMLSPVVFTAVLFLFRRRLGAWLRKAVIPRVPDNLRFLAAPMIATAIFAISWSYLHLASWYRVGIVPEVVFPVVIGLFTLATTTYGSHLRAKLRSFIQVRDRLWRPLRLLGALALPTLLAIAVVRSTSNVDLSSQLIVTISLVLVYVLMIPGASQPARRPI